MLVTGSIQLDFLAKNNSNINLIKKYNLHSDKKNYIDSAFKDVTQQ